MLGQRLKKRRHKEALEAALREFTLVCLQPSTMQNLGKLAWWREEPQPCPSRALAGRVSQCRGSCYTFSVTFTDQSFFYFSPRSSQPQKTSIMQWLLAHFLALR